VSVQVVILTRDSRLQDDVQNAAMLAMHTAQQSGVGVDYRRYTERYNIVVGRNAGVAKFLKTEHSHLMFIDDDVRVPQHAITRLLECDADIAGGCYVFLSEKGERGLVPSLAVKRGGRWQEGWFDGVVEAESVGCGCMLIRREVFGRIGEAPEWFQWPTWLDMNGLLACRSDDVDFCRRAKLVGCSVMAHGDVRCGHFRHVDLAAFIPQAQTV
jgi:GT2 family glycosyltransferase